MKVIPILMFHGYKDRYATDFNYLAENGYVTKHLSELTSFFVNPEEIKPPEKTVVLTFDDGLQDFYQPTFELLSKYNLKASICIPTGLISSDVTKREIEQSECGIHMTWDEIRLLEKEPLIEIIPHSVSHTRFNQFDGRDDKRALLEYEIGFSQQMLVERLGLSKRPQFFCFPGGAGWKTGEEINPAERLVIDVLRKYNYEGALRAELNANEKWNQFCIPRWNIDLFPSIEDSLTNISEI
jgi:peptidoglycan/xylan/chitin deacetylase (PgdA/CDA1 family)